MINLSITNIVLWVAFLLNLALGFLVYLKEPKRSVNISFSIFTWALSGWILGVSMFFLFKDPTPRLFWARMTFFSASIIPSAFFYFSLIFPQEKRTITPSKILLIFSPALMFAIASLTKLMVHSARWDTLTMNYGVAHKFFSVYLLAGMFGGIFFLIKSYRNSVGLKRIQIKYCLSGLLIMTIFGISFNLIIPMISSSRFSYLGPVSSIIMVSFISYAIVRHRLMDINIVFKKGTTYVLLILLFLVPSAILIVIFQKLFFKEINYLFSVIILSLLFVVARLFHEIKPGAEKAVEYVLFRNKYDYRETLGKFGRAMVSILDLQSLSRRIIDTIAQTMGVEKASLFLLNEEKGGFVLKESRNVEMELPTPMLQKGDPLPHYLQRIEEIIVREELMKGAHIPELKKVVDQMSLLEAEVSIPLLSKGRLIGFINLSHKFNKDIYSHEDIELLTTLAFQTSIAIENARLYEDLKKSKSYMRRADRLASLGTLATGLAHEIRNPLVAIKTFTQLLPDRLDDEEFRNHFLNVASSEVDRISSLITELLDFAKPSEPKLELEDINSILDGMLLLISTETKKKEISVVKNYTPNLPLVKVDREQIKQVFLNILLNAIDATPIKGRISVTTRSFIKPHGEPYLQIEFTDTGCGIPPEHLEEIFTPFFSTKDKGSGLGLAICHQIIQDHNGYIDVESELNRGTSFYINLPLQEAYTKEKKEDFIREHREGFDSVESA